MNDELLMLSFQGLAGLGMIIVILLTAAFVKLWNEISKLRGRRHDDRDCITENNSRLQILQYEVDDLKHELGRLKERIRNLVDSNKVTDNRTTGD